MYGSDFKRVVSLQLLSLHLHSWKSTCCCLERMTTLSLGLQYDTYFVIMEEWKMMSDVIFGA
jgi:hypothetical protein